MGRIRELMTVLPRTVKLGDSIVDAAKVMRGEDAGSPRSSRRPPGRRDHGSRHRNPRVAAGRDPKETKVEEIASLTLVTVDPDQDLDEALRLMAEHEVRRLPVVEEDGKLVGIVAQADVARHASHSRTGEVVEPISQ